MYKNHKMMWNTRLKLEAKSGWCVWFSQNKRSNRQVSNQDEDEEALERSVWCAKNEKSFGNSGFTCRSSDCCWGANNVRTYGLRSLFKRWQSRKTWGNGLQNNCCDWVRAHQSSKQVRGRAMATGPAGTCSSYHSAAAIHPSIHPARPPVKLEPNSYLCGL